MRIWAFRGFTRIVCQVTAIFRRGSNTVIIPFKTHRADFKIEEDRRKIEEDRGRWRKIKEDRGSAKRSRKIEEDRRISRKIEEDRGKIEEDRGKIEEGSMKTGEDRGNYVFFSEPSLGNFRDAGVFFEFLGGWSVQMGCILGPGFAFGAEPPPPPAVKFTLKAGLYISTLVLRQGSQTMASSATGAPFSARNRVFKSSNCSA